MARLEATQPNYLPIEGFVREVQQINELMGDVRAKYRDDESIKVLYDATQDALASGRRQQRLVTFMLASYTLIAVVLSIVTFDSIKRMRDAEYQVLTTTTSLSVATLDMGVTEELKRYADVVERMAKSNPPFGSERSPRWQNSYWMVEWVRSANTHMQAAHPPRKPRPGETVSDATLAREMWQDSEVQKWSQEGLMRVKQIFDSEGRRSVLRPDDRKRLYNFKAQLTNVFSSGYSERIQAYESAWSLRYVTPPNGKRSFDVIDWIVGNNLAMAILESEEAPGEKDLSRAWSIIKEVTEISASEVGNHRDIHFEYAYDTAIQLAQKLGPSVSAEQLNDCEGFAEDLEKMIEILNEMADNSKNTEKIRDRKAECAKLRDEFRSIRMKASPGH